MDSNHLVITHLPIPGGKAGAGRGQRWGWEAAERNAGFAMSYVDEQS